MNDFIYVIRTLETKIRIDLQREVCPGRFAWVMRNKFLNCYDFDMFTKIYQKYFI